MLLQELEKFKFVLDYKIKELKRQIEPKEEQITDMKDQVKVPLCCECMCLPHFILPASIKQGPYLIAH